MKVFRPTPAMKRAYKILAKPRLRELVETLLISHAPFEVVVHGLHVRHNFQSDEETIRLFKHFFWDIDLLDSMEMRALLEMRYSGVLEGGNDKEKLVQYPFLTRMRHGDPRIVAAKLPSSPLASMLTQMQMGVMPKSIPTAEIVQSTLDMANYRAWEAVHYGGPAGAQMGQGFTAIAEGMGRLKELVVNPETGLREDLRKIGVATTTITVPTLHQLSAGNHTVNVHPDARVDAIEVEGESVDDDEDGEFEDEEEDLADGQT